MENSNRNTKKLNGRSGWMVIDPSGGKSGQVGQRHWIDCTVFALKEKQIKQMFSWEFTIDQPARMMPPMYYSK